MPMQLEYRLPTVAALVFSVFTTSMAQSPQNPPFTDYGEMLGADDIQGKKSGFLAGNKVYYLGGVFLVQNLYENETIGLTHPFYHDLRSRGTGIAYHEGVGTGNDFSGWEWPRGTKVAYGTVVTDEMRWETPAPTHMYWRPDKMIVEYNLTNPFLQGVADGWCDAWREGSSSGVGLGKSFWSDLGITESQCWTHCNADPLCEQAVYQFSGASVKANCWIGLNKMTNEPTNRPGMLTRCYASGEFVPPLQIREEKFISANDVVSTIISSSRPITLEVSGHSFDGSVGGKITSLNGKCSVDVATNTIHVIEGGTAQAMVGQGPDVYADGKLMLDGMSAVLTASQAMQNISMYTVSPGVCGYTFHIPVDGSGTTISWASDDDHSTAIAAVQEVQADPSTHLAAKTSKVNGLLNSIVPYFRCSDDTVVKVYYFLWSIFLNYYTAGDQGMQANHAHTQSAVNNFLGMHRYDAVFQIRLGAWTSPAVHEHYANGNVLSWSQTMKYRRGPALPDNFGVDWASGAYGGEMIAHVSGACQVFEHSGNTTFLAAAYAFYKELFWDDIGDRHWGSAYDSILCLNRMASILGHPEDATHWNQTVGMSAVDDFLRNSWEKDTKCFWGSTEGGMGWGNLAYMGMSQFPRNYTLAMSHRWMNDTYEGFNTDVPLACTARKDWNMSSDPDSAEYNFAVTPDANWYMIRGLYQHNVDGLANQFVLDHLTKYNTEWGGIPVAPETRRMNFELHGDQYSNFNAGKPLLILEGIGGLAYSIQEDSFTFADNLPKKWTFMEYRVPVQQKAGSPPTWVKVRADRVVEGASVKKTVSVEGNPFTNLLVQPWAEDSRVAGSSPGSDASAVPGHESWTFNGHASATVELTLDSAVSTAPTEAEIATLCN